MACSRQEYWSGLPFPSPEDLPDPGIEPGSPALQADCLPSDRPDRHKLKHQKSMAISPRAVWGGVPWWFTCSAPAHLRELCLWGVPPPCAGGSKSSALPLARASVIYSKVPFSKALTLKKKCLLVLTQKKRLVLSLGCNIWPQIIQAKFWVI